MLPYKKSLKSRSRELRSSMTDAEIALWTKLRRKQLLGLQFYRQKPLGHFIVDFYCASARLVIEIDGGQHYEKEGAAQDAVRDRHLQSLGLEVLRFSNLDVLGNMDGVIAVITQHLETALDQKKTKSPRPPFSKGE
jgi:very-short-patch-repair endonuclease